jgi:response regulator of citrate/malate metabolism
MVFTSSVSYPAIVRVLVVEDEVRMAALLAEAGRQATRPECSKRYRSAELSARAKAAVLQRRLQPRLALSPTFMPEGPGIA